MLTDLKQNELDLAEEKLLIAVFGSTEPDAKVQWLLKFLDIDLNKYIQNFENVMKPLMNDNGLVNANALQSVVSLKFPTLSKALPSQDFRLSDTTEQLLTIVKELIYGRA